MDFVNPRADMICAYIEHLAQHFKAYKSVANYTSAIKLLHHYMHQKLEHIQDFEVTLMLRATS